MYTPDFYILVKAVKDIKFIVYKDVSWGAK